MAFVRTGLIIVALVLGWMAVRLQPMAHAVPTQSAQVHAAITYRAS